MKKIILFLFITGFVFTGVALAASASVVTKETLQSWMENGAVTVLDVRQGRDWSASEFKIKSAQREEPDQLSDWKTKYAKDQKLVLYCA